MSLDRKVACFFHCSAENENLKFPHMLQIITLTFVPFEEIVSSSYRTINKQNTYIYKKKWGDNFTGENLGGNVISKFNIVR